MRKILRICLGLLLCLTVAGAASCGEKEKGSNTTLTITSESINEDGNLLQVCSADNGLNGATGENLSPQLSFNAIDGALSYYILMLDSSASNWMHWRQGVKKTTLDQGQASSTQYVGPYPPAGGAHVYRIYVYALNVKSLDGFVGKFDQANTKVKIEEAFGDSIITSAYIEAKFANGDQTK